MRGLVIMRGSRNNEGVRGSKIGSKIIGGNRQIGGIGGVANVEVNNVI